MIYKRAEHGPSVLVGLRQKTDWPREDYKSSLMKTSRNIIWLCLPFF